VSGLLLSAKHWFVAAMMEMPCREGQRMTSSALNSEQDLATVPTAQGGLSRLVIAHLKSAGVPVFWVGLPSIRGPKSTTDMQFLNDLYRARAEKCEEMAKQRPSLGAKQLYESLANQWRELAKQAESGERANDTT
jgi:hypothetical protein